MKFFDREEKNRRIEENPREESRGSAVYCRHREEAHRQDGTGQASTGRPGLRVSLRVS